MKKISSLQYITTSAALAEQACKGGVDWIQLRLKDISYEDYRATALEVQAMCKKYNATFIVNDNIKLALEINADGVHVGKDDPLPQDYIDEMLVRGGIIGCTANTIEDFAHLAGKPVSYIGLGPFRFTTTKQKLSPVLGLEGYSRILRELKDKRIPSPAIIAIGGIKVEDVKNLLGVGVNGVAVAGAITNSGNIEAVAAAFRKAARNEIGD